MKWDDMGKYKLVWAPHCGVDVGGDVWGAEWVFVGCDSGDAGLKLSAIGTR